MALDHSSLFVSDALEAALKRAGKTGNIVLWYELTTTMFPQLCDDATDWKLPLHFDAEKAASQSSPEGLVEIVEQAQCQARERIDERRRQWRDCKRRQAKG